MVQAKFSLHESQIEFLGNCGAYGFKDKSAMVRAALERFKEELEIQSLKRSADLYTEVYGEDPEIGELTEAAVSGWPE